MKRTVRLSSVFALACVASLYVDQPAAAQRLGVDQILLKLTHQADSQAYVINESTSLGLTVIGGDKLAYKYVGLCGFNQADTADFVVVSPSSGVAPTTVAVALNPNVVPYLFATGWSAILQFVPAGQTPGPCWGPTVSLDLSHAEPPQIQSVVNAATLQPDISPGAVVSIFGKLLGTAPVTTQYDAFGLYPTNMYHGKDPHIFEGVTFNGIPAAILYYSQNQINAVVPYGVAGQASVNVVVTHHGFQAAPFAVPLKDTSPGVFTTGQNGNGQGAILMGTLALPNNANNPAPKGSVITLYATGFGIWGQPVSDGTILFSGGTIYWEPLPTVTSGCPKGSSAPCAPISLSIGGQPALLLYVGPSLGIVSGILQINAYVPNGIGSGPQPVVLTAGQNSNSQQQVTAAVQ